MLHCCVPEQFCSAVVVEARTGGVGTWVTHVPSLFWVLDFTGLVLVPATELVRGISDVRYVDASRQCDLADQDSRRRDQSER